MDNLSDPYQSNTSSNQPAMVTEPVASSDTNNDPQPPVPPFPADGNNEPPPVTNGNGFQNPPPPPPKPQNKSKLLIAAIVLLLVITIPLAIYVVQQQQDIRQRASGTYPQCASDSYVTECNNVSTGAPCLGPGTCQNSDDDERCYCQPTNLPEPDCIPGAGADPQCIGHNIGDNCSVNGLSGDCSDGAIIGQTGCFCAEPLCNGGDGYCSFGSLDPCPDGGSPSQAPIGQCTAPFLQCCTGGGTTPSPTPSPTPTGCNNGNPNASTHRECVGNSCATVDNAPGVCDLEGNNDCDVDSECGGGGGNPSPTPQPVAQCTNIKIYQVVGDPLLAASWQLLTTQQLAALQPGATVYISTLGGTSNGATITRARIRVNVTIWTQALHDTVNLKPKANQNEVNEYYVVYTIPTDGTANFTVGAEVYSPQFDSNTNPWDTNTGWR